MSAFDHGRRLVTAGRLHRQARRWRLGLYLSIPVVLFGGLAGMGWMLRQLTP